TFCLSWKGLFQPVGRTLHESFVEVQVSKASSKWQLKEESCTGCHSRCIEKVQKEVNAVLTESAVLSCEVAEDATEVKWYKDGRLLVSSRKFKIETVGKTRRLVVEQLEKKDAGEYVCEAAGQKLTFKLEPTGDICFCFIK
uniref:Ig-like domain-containing protein n=1 Tax=Anas platyrhynchos platyrhynchos TaxID=8840 RepID=A0A493TXH9_ANAPP